MACPLPRTNWLAEAADRCADLEAWRQAHPRANWAEIERVVDGDAHTEPRRVVVLPGLEPPGVVPQLVAAGADPIRPIVVEHRRLELAEQAAPNVEEAGAAGAA